MTSKKTGAPAASRLARSDVVGSGPVGQIGPVGQVDDSPTRPASHQPYQTAVT
jgi:hypothetical protein